MQVIMKRSNHGEPEAMIQLGEYPYTYARVAAMRSKLLKKEDYQKLLKMKLNEIIKYLDDLEYKKEIDELASLYSGVDLLEIALNRNLVKTFFKLKSISSLELNLLIRAYLGRNDVWNVKTILRGKYTNASEDYLKKLIIPAGTFKKEFLISLFKKDSIEDILKSLPHIHFREMQKAYEHFSKHNDLSAIENFLDQHYYHGIMDLAKALPIQGKLFREFLEKEMEVLNILTITRSLRDGLSKGIVKDHLIKTGKPGTDALFRKMAELENLAQISDRIKDPKLKGIVEEGLEKFKQEKSLVYLESSLQRHLVKKSVLLLHKHPLSVDVILGYMFAKENEVKNLKMLLKGKQLGMSESFIEGELVIAG